MAMTMEIEAIYQQGFEYRCSGRYLEARAEFMRVLEAEPTHSNSRWQLGIILGFEGDFDGSLAALQGVVRDFPSHEEAIYDLAMTEMMLGMMDEACTHFHQILEMNPDHENAKRQVVYCP